MTSSAGLDISEEQFIKLPSKERDLIIFRNLSHNRRKVKNDTLNRKLQYIWLGILTVALGLKKYIGF